MPKALMSSPTQSDFVRRWQIPGVRMAYRRKSKQARCLLTKLSRLCRYKNSAGSNSSVEEMLGNQGVTESNMMQYLGIIEQRTSEILQAYATSQQLTQAANTQVRASL